MLLVGLPYFPRTDSYAIQNEYEYFAVGTQLYFDATLNYGSCDNLMRFDRLRARDRDLAEIVELVS